MQQKYTGDQYLLVYIVRILELVINHAPAYHPAANPTGQFLQFYAAYASHGLAQVCHMNQQLFMQLK